MKQQEKTKSSDGVLNPSKDKEKKKQEKKKCTYCHKGWNLESACMKKTIDMMAQLLKNNNIPLPQGARNKEGGSSSKNKERCHDLVVGSSRYSSFIIDSGASKNMNSWTYILTLVHPSSWVMIQKYKPKGLEGLILNMGTLTMFCLCLILQ